jgi:hypothetical protein
MSASHPREVSRSIFRSAPLPAWGRSCPMAARKSRPSGSTSTASTSSSIPPKDARKTATSAAIPASRSPSSIPKIPTAISKFAVASSKSPKTAPTTASTSWPRKYLGVDKYPYAQPSEVRVIYKIKPEHTTVMGYRFMWGGHSCPPASRLLPRDKPESVVGAAYAERNLTPAVQYRGRAALQRRVTT